MPLAIVWLLTVAEPAPLPVAWQGTYTGTMVVNALADPKKTIPITLEVVPEKEGSGVTWKMTFVDGPQSSVKDYRLVPTARPGEFMLDEKNGLQLPTRVAGNVMISTFEVGGTLLVARYELKAQTLTYEIQSYGKPADSAPGVKTFALKSLQTAELTKK